MIAFDGGDCPVPSDTFVRVLFRCDKHTSGAISVQGLRWEHDGRGGDIMAFEVAEPGGWHDHEGAECPVHPDVFVQMDSLRKPILKASDVAWENVSQYLVVPTPKDEEAHKPWEPTDYTAPVITNEYLKRAKGINKEDNSCREESIAKMEAERNHSADLYFAARPSLDNAENRKLFEAGFERGHSCET